MFSPCPSCGPDGPLYYCNEHQLTECRGCRSWVPWSFTVSHDSCEDCDYPLTLKDYYRGGAHGTK